jgi:shikimate kinase
MPRMNPAPNLVLVGPMGAGKTSIGRRLAERFALAFVDADREIEAQAGASIATIFECEGEPGFRARERTALARLLADEALVIATGGGAVLDPVNRALLRTRGFVVHLQVSVDGQLQRLSRDRVRPLLQQGDRTQILQDLALARAPLYADVADLVFDTEGLAATEAARRLGEQLQVAWTRGAAA